MSEVSLGSVYDINKNLMSKENKLSLPALENKLKKVKEYFINGNKYYMLLCHERRDYTVFNLLDALSPTKAVKELKECLLNRGNVLSIEKVEGAFEIWLKIDDEAFCYYLFPYDNAVIEV